ncbi:elongin-C [Enteropsectra breve]|nr:elongin-C [Enteropsectra breve]
MHPDYLLYKYMDTESRVPENKVVLISSDNTSFIVDREIAILSKTINIFLNQEFPFNETVTRTINLPFPSNLLKRIIEFMEYKYASIISQNNEEFVISDEETTDLLDVASYLRI